MKPNSAPLREKYPKYKSSGVEWLGEVPEHWDYVSLKWASIRYSGGTPDKAIDEYWENGRIPWLNSGAVNEKYITQPSCYITEKAFNNSSAKWIPKEALVIALAGQGKTKGLVAQIGIETTCNQSMAAIIPNNRINTRLLYWWLTKNYINIRNLGGGEARDGLNLEMLGSIPVPLPPLPEQQAIADFLDRETGRIDALIEKKKKLLELLKEKRTALISRAVTKGLAGLVSRGDAEFAEWAKPVKMKPSGVEWLGEVPEHWEVKKLKYIKENSPNAFVDGPFGSNLKSEHFIIDGDVFVIESNFATRGKLNEEELKQIEYDHYETIKRSETKAGDIIISKIGAYFGLNNILPEISKKAVVSGNSMKLSINKLICDVQFIHYQFLVLKWYGAIDLMVSTTAQPALTLGGMNSLNFLLPPLPEQQAIAAFLDRETAKLDALSAKIETAIEKLKEFRTALISAAVTGKIDVREAV